MAETVMTSASLEEIDIPEGEKGSATPLILIHDGSGTTFQYYLLEPLNRPIYAISNPYFSTGTKPPGGIPQLAKEYIRAIEKEISNGDIIIGGWSLGGCIAFEIARILSTSSGLKISGLVLIDSYCPWSEGTWKTVHAQLYFQKTTSEKIKDLVGRSFANAREMSNSWDKPLPFEPPPAVLICAVDSKPVLDASNLLTEADGRLGWSQFESLKFSSILNVAGHHYTIFEENMREGLSQTIREACDALSRSFIRQHPDTVHTNSS